MPAALYANVADMLSIRVCLYVVSVRHTRHIVSNRLNPCQAVNDLSQKRHNIGT